MVSVSPLVSIEGSLRVHCFGYLYKIDFFVYFADWRGECAGVEAEDHPRFEDLNDTDMDALLQKFCEAMNPASAYVQYGKSVIRECQMRNKS